MAADSTVEEKAMKDTATRYMRLVNLHNECEKLHARYVHWLERRQMGHAYEVEMRALASTVEDLLHGARSMRDMGAAGEEYTLPTFAFTVLQRKLDELKGTLDRIERVERSKGTEKKIKW